MQDQMATLNRPPTDENEPLVASIEIAPTVAVPALRVQSPAMNGSLADCAQRQQRTTINEPAVTSLANVREVLAALLSDSPPD